LQKHCTVVGRDEDSIRKTISSEVFIRETEEEIVQAGSLNVWGKDAVEWRNEALVGTPDQVSEKIQRYLDAGCTGFIPWCSDYPSTETLELFAKKVIPNFR
jgi:alkanesulfonate monooxygenase SsuD/methylene tetrahydromethanopterin reductase-like flavin-dependent oxidoreductase (luciferase family)